MVVATREIALSEVGFLGDNVPTRWKSDRLVAGDATGSPAAGRHCSLPAFDRLAGMPQRQAHVGDRCHARG